jgi:hypothetical protein
MVGLILLISLTSCTEGTPIEYYFHTAQEVISQMADKGDLSARAVVASGLYDSLDEESHPFTLFLIRQIPVGSGTTRDIVVEEDNTLKNYLAEQGLTESEFLAHPKLRTFVESHFIPEDVNLYNFRTIQNVRRVYEAASGEDIVFTTGNNVVPADGDVVFANGVPISSYSCFFDVNPSPSGGYGQICYADAPLVSDFDWSE